MAGYLLQLSGGGRTLCSLLAPTGAVYQAGTMAGNPVAVACGIKTLQILASGNIYATLATRTRSLVTGLMMLAKEYHIPLTADGEGGMFGLFLAADAITSYEQAMQTDNTIFRPVFSFAIGTRNLSCPLPIRGRICFQLSHRKGDRNHFGKM